MTLSGTGSSVHSAEDSTDFRLAFEFTLAANQGALFVVLQSPAAVLTVSIDSIVCFDRFLPNIWYIRVM